MGKMTAAERRYPNLPHGFPVAFKGRFREYELPQPCLGKCIELRMQGISRLKEMPFEVEDIEFYLLPHTHHEPFRCSNIGLRGRHLQINAASGTFIPKTNTNASLQSFYTRPRPSSPHISSPIVSNILSCIDLWSSPSRQMKDMQGNSDNCVCQHRMGLSRNAAFSLMHRDRATQEEVMPTAQTQGEADSKSDQFRKEMAERAGGMLSYAEVAARLGSGVEVVDEQYRQRRLLGVTYHGRVGFPAAQFVDNEILSGLDTILSVLGDTDPWEQLMLLTTPLEGYGFHPESAFQILARSPDGKMMRQLAALLSSWVT
nr:hypothetical protein [Sphingobium sp. CFD-1]